MNEGGKGKVEGVGWSGYSLNDSLAEGLGADDSGALVILEGASHDFAGRRGVFIHLPRVTVSQFAI